MLKSEKGERAGETERDECVREINLNERKKEREREERETKREREKGR